ncbi:MAG: nitroreductase/quinone reductase family protein, partial [Acidimicrobiales bacterium]
MSDDSPQGPSQKVEMEWETPSHEEIIQISRGHVMGLEMSDDEAVWCVAGMHHVLLHTIGRRSGNEHKVALPFWRDAEGHRIVVGSFAGATRDPSWVLNLR